MKIALCRSFVLLIFVSYWQCCLSANTTHCVAIHAIEKDTQ